MVQVSSWGPAAGQLWWPSRLQAAGLGRRQVESQLRALPGLWCRVDRRDQPAVAGAHGKADRQAPCGQRPPASRPGLWKRGRLQLESPLESQLLLSDVHAASPWDS